MRARVADRLPGGQALMAAKIIGDDDVARSEFRDEALADPGGEGITVDRPVQNEGGNDTVVTQPRQEGQGLPVPMRGFPDEPLAASAPASERRHVGLGPSLVDEDQAGRIDRRLMRFPARSPPGDVRPVLYAGKRGFF